MKPQEIQELRKIIAGSSRIEAFHTLLEALAEEVSDIRISLKPTDSLEIRQALRKYLLDQLDLLRRIPHNSTNDRSPVRRDDT